MSPQTASRGGLGWIGVVMLLVVVFLALFHLDSTPPLWWDEGWTLSVARNWVERGFYGRLLAGELAAPGLEAAFPTTALVALCFRVLGVGAWQGRLVGVLCLAGAGGLLFHLAGRLYNRRVAIATVVVLLLLSVHRETHPLVMGRQVLAELPMLLCLLAGYAFLLATLRRSAWFAPLTIVCWGVALWTKAQVLPFWVLSLLVPLGIALFGRQWRTAALLGSGLLGSLLVSRLLPWLTGLFLRGHTLPPDSVRGLYDVTAIAPASSLRPYAVGMAFVIGLPSFLGLCWSVRGWIKSGGWKAHYSGTETVRLALLSFSVSWLAWYLLLSIGVPRYFFPVSFVGSMFAAALIGDLTDQFRFRHILDRVAGALRNRRIDRTSMQGILVLVLLAIYVSLTLGMLYEVMVTGNRSAFLVADFFATQTAPDTLVETYDGELIALIDRPYHYPPDQLHVELLRRLFLHQNVPIEYDPLAADPDYLVVGHFSRVWRLYEPVLATGAFRRIETVGLYDIYERVR